MSLHSVINKDGACTVSSSTLVEHLDFLLVNRHSFAFICIVMERTVRLKKGTAKKD